MGAWIEWPVSAKRGVFLPPFDELFDPRTLVELAQAAEERGWDGFFLWDHIAYRAPVRALADPWIALAAIASQTEKLRLRASSSLRSRGGGCRRWPGRRSHWTASAAGA